MRFLALIPLFFALTACVTPGSNGYRGYVASEQELQSRPISLESLNNCRDEQCLFILAEQESYKAHRTQKDIINVSLAETLFSMKAEQQALGYLSRVNSAQLKNRFYVSFGAFDKGKVNKYFSDRQRWQQSEVPLPKSLLGQNDRFDSLYAAFLIFNQEFEQARIIAQKLKSSKKRNQLLLLLVKGQLSKKKFDDAWSTANSIRPEQKTLVREEAIALVAAALYINGKKDDAFTNINNMISAYWKSSANAGIVIAMASQNKLNDALVLLSKIKDKKIKTYALSGILLSLAKQGDVKTINQLLASQDESLNVSKLYPNLIFKMAKSGHIEPAKELLQSAPTDKSTVFALSKLGAATADTTYFQRALILANETKQDNKLETLQLSLSIASDMASIGLLEDSVRTLHTNLDTGQRSLSRLLIFSGLFNSLKVPKDYDRILDVAELDIKKSTPNEYFIILNNLSRFLFVDKATLAGIDRYLSLTNSVPNKQHQEILRAKIIPHLAYLGEIDRANQLIHSFKNTAVRVSAILRLANFHIIKKNINTI
jgi:hypothetical protein